MSFAFPAIQSIHLVGIGLLVGTIVLVDLRRLELALRRYAVVEVAEQLAPWTRARCLWGTINEVEAAMAGQ